MASLAEVFVTVRPDTDKFEPELKRKIKAVDARKAAEDAGKRSGGRFVGGFGSSLGKVKTLIGGAFAGLAVGAFLKDSISAASDLGETVNKANVIFGKGAPEIQKWAKTAATSFGLSRQEALEAAAGMGNMLTQLGYTGDAARKASTDTVQLAADLGSFNNLPTGDVLDRISAAMRGEYDSLQLLIPNINAARVEQEAMAMTGKTVAKELTAQEKAAATLAIVQRDGAAAAGDFAETSGGLANQSKILSSQFTDIKAVVGGALVPVLADAASRANEFLQEMQAGEGAGGRFADSLRAVWEQAKGAFDYFKTDVLPVLTSVGGFLWDNKEAVVALGVAFLALNAIMSVHATVMAVQAAGGLAAYIAQTRIVQAATKAWAAVQWLLNIALSANPIGLVIIGLIALGAGLVLAYKKSETFRDIVNGAWDAVKSGWNSLIEAVQNLWNNRLKPTWDSVATAASKLWSDFIRPALAKIKEGWDWAVGAVRAVWETVLSPVFDRVKTGIGRVADAFGTARDAIGRAFDGIRDAAKAPIKFVVNTVMNDALIGNFNKIAKFFGSKQIDTISLPRGFATGGHVDGPGTGTSDSILARLSRGEFVVRASAAAKNRDLLEAINSEAPGFAGGGAVDWVKSNLKAAGGRIADLTQEGVASVKNAAGKVIDIASDPVGFLREKVTGLIKKIGDTDFAGSARSAGTKLLDYAVEKVKALFDFSSAETGGAATPNGTRGMGPAAKKAAAAVRSIFGFAGTIGGYANRNIAGTNKLSKHALGKAIDVMTYRNMALGQRIANFFIAARRAYNVDNVIFNRRIWNGGAPGGKRYGGRNPHTDHPHIDFFDDGGVAKGMGFLPKRTLRAERVLSPQQTESFERLVRLLESGGGPSREFHYHAAAGRSMPREDFEDAVGRARLIGW